MIAGINRDESYYVYLEKDCKDFSKLRHDKVLIGPLVRTKIPLREILELKLGDAKPKNGTIVEYKTLDDIDDKGRLFRHDAEQQAIGIHRVYMTYDDYLMIDKKGYAILEYGMDNACVNIVDDQSVDESGEFHDFRIYKGFLEQFFRDPIGMGLKQEVITPKLNGFVLKDFLKLNKKVREYN